jgi:type IV pilus assembly protein PilQ
VNKDFTILNALRRMLSPNGRLDYLERSNVIFLKDIKPVVDEISRMVAEVDLEPGQVLVDVKFVTTKNSDLLDVGVHIGDNGWVASIGLGQIPTRLPFDLGNGGWDDHIIANDSRRGPFTDPTLNAGATLVPDTIYGALNLTQVTAALRFLKRDTSTEIVQAPKIIALDHQEATIFVGDTIRYAQAKTEQGQAGGLSLSVEEAPKSPVQTGFQLLVTPHIIPGTDKVQLEVIPASESLSGTSASPLAPAGFDVFTVGSGAAAGTIALPRISSSTIATKMMLRSGQTAVIGGLTTESNTQTELKVPFLGDIPILGWMFKNKSSSKSRSSLIVFVTPEIVRSPEETDAAIKSILDERRKALQDEYTRIFGAGG